MCQGCGTLLIDLLGQEHDVRHGSASLFSSNRGNDHGSAQTFLSLAFLDWVEIFLLQGLLETLSEQHADVLVVLFLTQFSHAERVFSFSILDCFHLRLGH